LPNVGHSDVLIGWHSRELYDAKGAVTSKALAVQEAKLAWGYGIKRDGMLRKLVEGYVQSAVYGIGVATFQAKAARCCQEP
jgi:hypothetical protein